MKRLLARSGPPAAGTSVLANGPPLHPARGVHAPSHGGAPPAGQPATCDVPTSSADPRERLGASTAAAEPPRPALGRATRASTRGGGLPNPAGVSATRRLAWRRSRCVRRVGPRAGVGSAPPGPASPDRAGGRVGRAGDATAPSKRRSASCPGHAVCGGSYASTSGAASAVRAGDAHAGRCVSGRGRGVPRQRSLRRGPGLGSGADEGMRRRGRR